MIAIVDSGPLYAAVDADDDDHDRCVEVLGRMDLDIVVPALVVAEVTYLVGRRLGPAIEAAFLRGLASFEVEAPRPNDWPRIADLVERYGDFPLGGTDASVIALADRLDTRVILTLDRRHFGAVRSRTDQPFLLLPE
ncbi:MAG: PIN domain-containing protein [Chloroflexi bacterium]|nr:PIN domain-containing protein [Chloroflexota bacterium]